jgi:formate hydrogenlyase subunit 3/multisubunit Na+/H+ antiporter MnhD subunit
MPTPVSALLHAATLVTAGIYLLIRISPILEFSGSVLLIITLIGSSTAFFAATCGLLQNDLKRIIAFSTISQLGYILFYSILFYSIINIITFLIYNILYLDDIHTSIFSKIIKTPLFP